MTDGAGATAGHCVLACSPRRHGNSDLAAELTRRALLEATGLPGLLLRVTDYTVRPCAACGYCGGTPGHCALHAAGERDETAAASPMSPMSQDQAVPLLRALCGARAACLISPIYFYHVPAQLKALLDRSQCFWRLPDGVKPGCGGPLGVILIAGRPRGAKLFQGALLSLRYAARALGMSLADPLLLYGLDEADALAHRPDMQEEIKAYAHRLAPAARRDRTQRLPGAGGGGSDGLPAAQIPESS